MAFGLTLFDVINFYTRKKNVLTILCQMKKHFGLKCVFVLFEQKRSLWHRIELHTKASMFHWFVNNFFVVSIIVPCCKGNGFKSTRYKIQWLKTTVSIFDQKVSISISLRYFRRMLSQALPKK